jgi:hypothetical protein
MRKIITLTENQIARIKDEARRRGISETEVIRRLVDKWLD